MTEPTMHELLQRSSLGCPTGDCDHLITAHDADDYDNNGHPINPVCRADDCNCGATT